MPPPQLPKQKAFGNEILSSFLLYYISFVFCTYHPIDDFIGHVKVSIRPCLFINKTTSHLISWEASRVRYKYP